MEEWNGSKGLNLDVDDVGGQTIGSGIHIILRFLPQQF
jgi:hypothetical protein